MTPSEGLFIRINTVMYEKKTICNKQRLSKLILKVIVFSELINLES